MTHASTPHDDRPTPARLLCLVALVATHGLLRLTERYLPEYLSALGYGPILVGALTSLGLAVAALVAGRSSPRRDRESSLEATVAGPTGIAALAVALTALGLLAWAGAPSLDALLGTPLTALGWLAAGIVLVQAWHGFSPVSRLWPVDIRIVGASARPADRRSTVVGALGVGAAAVVATVAVSSATSVRAGFPLLAAAGATGAVIAAIALATADGETDDRRSSDGDAADATDPTDASDRTVFGAVASAASAADPPTAESVPSLESIRRAARTLPDRWAWPLLGDTLVRAAILAVAPFLILLFVDHRAVALESAGLALEPAALFGLFVLGEAVGSLVGAFVASVLASRFDREWLLAGGLAVLSLFPMAFVAAPASPAVVAALFVLFGCRTAIEPLRPTLGAAGGRGDRTAPDSATDPTRSTLEPPTGVRLALVPAPLFGGLLYAASPVAAFTVATTVGLLGVRELLRALEAGTTD